MWAVGDWLLEGEERVLKSKKRLMVREVAAGLTGYSKHTLAMAVSVSRKVKPPVRIDGLSWWHHLVVAHLSANEQATWLTQAAEHEWSVSRFRDELREPGSGRQKRGLDRTADSLVRQLITVTRMEISDDLLTELHRWWQGEIEAPNLASS
jgi:hypothetical protein